MRYTRLREEWEALLNRRPTFREPLAAYEPILAAWDQWPRGGALPLSRTAAECRACWQQGMPLLVGASPPVAREEMEALVGPAIEVLAALGEAPWALQRFAEAWDRGGIDLSALLPSQGRIGSESIRQNTGLSREALAFLAYASLRPILDQYFSECRAHLPARGWDLGICPFCGAPPGFADLLEDGQRRLACHFCGAEWSFARLRCPYCGSQNASDFVRLLAEDEEEGYAISACKGCHGYVKELDRRVRWNGGPALVEDWGSPHLDLVATRSGYWRPIPTLIQLGKSE